MWPYHLHVLIENLRASSSWKHQGLSRPGFTFCLINIPDKCLDNGGPWRVLLALNFGTEWMRVIGSCAGCRTAQDWTHHIDRLGWYHSLVERCTRLLFHLPAVEARSSSLYSLCLLNHYPGSKLLESASRRISVQFAVVLSRQLVSTSYSRSFPSCFPTKRLYSILLLNHLQRFCSVEWVISG